MRLSGQNLALSYESFVVAADLTVEIPDGQITVLIGPNGCGKSTTLRALSRLTATGTGGMGELFKVLAISDPRLSELPGFQP